jgi:hypothetical protein
MVFASCNYNPRFFWEMWRGFSKAESRILESCPRRGELGVLAAAGGAACLLLFKGRANPKRRIPADTPIEQFTWGLYNTFHNA